MLRAGQSHQCGIVSQAPNPMHCDVHALRWCSVSPCLIVSGSHEAVLDLRRVPGVPAHAGSRDHLPGMPPQRVIPHSGQQGRIHRRLLRCRLLVQVLVGGGGVQHDTGQKQGFFACALSCLALGGVWCVACYYVPCEFVGSRGNVLPVLGLVDAERRRRLRNRLPRTCEKRALRCCKAENDGYIRCSLSPGQP